ncbi:hypothetical protein APH_1002 [Anaplasma phagocytophilum str. HZ]|uniref:Uncharacterized protein n=1 Tax=Anaplasma phagocytophilum (strain HZ) TaxID=212042 RepID=Q2GJ88_ANAPZ|nr:hypothetical protein APH_1002 [Anaplasma phagocytophilum str. HZ]
MAREGVHESNRYDVKELWGVMKNGVYRGEILHV